MFNLKSIYDLPSIGRLNNVHHEGVPSSLCLEHFIFLTESTQCVMEYNGNYRIVVRGYYSSKWHSSFYTVYESPFIREILPIWYETIACIVADQNIRHGFVDVYFDPPLENVLDKFPTTFDFPPSEPVYGPGLPSSDRSFDDV